MASKPVIEEIEEHVEIRPGVGFYQLIPALRYSIWVALGEMVDNSVQSYLEHKNELVALHGPKYRLRIDISFHSGENQRIMIVDNAAGIFEKDFHRAFTPASPPANTKGISQYGIGMKSSACWFSKNFSVESRALGEEVKKTVTFDIDEILRLQSEKLLVSKVPKSPDDHGTRIILDNLHQQIPVGATLSKVRKYLSSIYRELLRAGDLTLVVGGEELKYESPTWLTSPFWPNEKGPIDTIDREWICDVDIILDESWEQDKSPSKPEEPQRIRGFVAILGKGATKQAGLSLIWRKKVVQGAGGEAESNEDLYRPVQIFGASNSYERQRIFGEIDVSDLNVTSFKDAINWRPEQEEELLRKLHAQINSEELPILKMTKNFRANIKTPLVVKRVEETIEGVANIAGEGILATSPVDFGLPLPPFSVEAETPAPPKKSNDQFQDSTIVLTPNFDKDVVLEVKSQPGDPSWLRVTHENRNWRVTINRDHPFMNSFASTAESEFEPILRLALAIGMAEISAKNAGKSDPDFIRIQINAMLRNVLSQKGSVS
jgi:hypothetical protein